MAILSVTVALLLTLAIETLIAQSIVVLFFAAVAITAWYGGLKPGIVAIVLSTWVCDYFLIPPVYSSTDQTASSLLQLAEFILVAVIICFAVEQLQAAKRRLLQGNRRLEQEIQERSAAEDALRLSEATVRESEERLRLAIEGADLGMWNYDLISRQLLWSERCKQIFGLAPQQEMTYEVFLNALHPDDRSRVDAAVQRAIAQQEDYNMEYRTLWSDGSTHWVASLGRAYYTEHGEPLRMSGVALDTTARKQAEIALIERERRLRRHSQALAELANHEAIANGDLETALAVITKKAADALEVERVSVWLYSDDRAILQCINLYKRSQQTHSTGSQRNRSEHPIYFQAMAAARTITVTDTRTDPRVQEFRYDLFQPENIVSVIDAPVWVGGEVVGVVCHEQVGPQRQWELTEQSFVGSIADFVALTLEVWNRKQVEADLREAKDDAEAANRAKSTFLANMSHELRTPLNSILGITEALQDEVCGPLTEEQRKSLTTLETSGNHLLELINDILDLAKIESGKMELQPALVSIQGLCASSLTYVRQQAFQKKIRLSSRIPEALEPIQVDERRVRQVLINLLSNAVKFTPERGEVWIEVQPDRINHQINITVVDTGIGIARDNLSKLFQPFMQLESSYTRRYTGTGLGLSLVRRIVDLHGGSVKAESQVGEGSRFTVTLPWREEGRQKEEGGGRRAEGQDRDSVSMSDASVSDASSLTPLQSARQKDSSWRILLAEDNEANIFTMTQYLNAKGYQIILAKNGLEAIELTKSQKPDLILMDVQMPEMDGLEATRRIRSNSEIARTPIIALTSFAMTADREQCIAAGVDAYLPKPVSLRDLVETIEQHLSRTPSTESNVLTEGEASR